MSKNYEEMYDAPIEYVEGEVRLLHYGGDYTVVDTYVMSASEIRAIVADEINKLIGDKTNG